MTKRQRRIALLILTGIIIFVASILGFPDIMRWITGESPATDPNIPTSFSGNRMIYGFALFSLFTTTSLAIRKLFVIGMQLRDEDWRQDPDVGLYRITVAACLLTIITACGPDVIVLMLWGEAGDKTMETALTIDRVCDSLVAIPAIGAILFQVRAEQFTRQPDLAEYHALAGNIDIGPRDRTLFKVTARKESIEDNLKIIGFVLVIAAGLAIFK